MPSTWTQGEEATAAAAIAFGGATTAVGYLTFAAFCAWWEKSDRHDMYERSETSIGGEYRYPLWAKGYVALLEAIAGFSLIVAYVISGAATPRIDENSAWEWALVCLVPFVVSAVIWVGGVLFWMLLKSLDRRHWLVEPGREFATPAQQFAVLVPFTLTLFAWFALNLPVSSSGTHAFLLLLGLLVLVFLVTPLLASSSRIRTALLPLRARAHAPPCEPPITTTA